MKNKQVSHTHERVTKQVTDLSYEILLCKSIVVKKRDEDNVDKEQPTVKIMMKDNGMEIK